MIFYGQVCEGKLKLNNKEAFEKYISGLGEGTSVMLDAQKATKTRSDKQNGALHLWFTQVAKALNKDGFDMRVFISSGVDIMWTPYTVKEYLFRPMSEALFGKKSSKTLNTDEIDKIIDPINKVMGERAGIYVPFPSVEEQYKNN